MNNQEVGSIDIPPEVRILLTEFVEQLVEQLGDDFTFKNGSTALYFHLASVLHNHIGDRK